MMDKETHSAAADKKRKRKCGSREVDEIQEKTPGTLNEEVEGSGSSMTSPPIRKEEIQESTTFIVLHKNTRSTSTSESKMGRDIDLRDMAPRKRNLGSRTGTHRDRIREIHQQAWSRDHTE